LASASPPLLHLPLPPLFPYTTLFRSLRVLLQQFANGLRDLLPTAVSDRHVHLHAGTVLGARRSRSQPISCLLRKHVQRTHDLDRSEEHTSELQSRFDLVCRLLLEKKN